MADYGHDLAFGTFITPQARRPEDVVALAQLTERAGLDLVTFQDHPYQPAFLDTWTLLAWVAARTERVHVAPNVANLPLRPPAVLARSAASLDRLSGGRVALGLGAGAFWDGIEAMGGRRLTPGQAVDALAEAVEVIRAIWDVAQRGGVRIDGEHHRVRGAKRGPEPAHDIPIWLGAYRPRMLRLTGRAADGWLPSLSYLERDAIGPANAAIDEAARAAGRDPREIRRLLNLNDPALLEGPPERWVERLLPLALEHGFSTFIVAADDPRTIETFGGEVAPALREAVARERRAAGTDTGAVRPARKLALRRAGIAYDRLPASLADATVEPGDRGYADLRSTYLHAGSPGLVLRPERPEQVADALRFAREQPVPLAIRSGGHGIGARATNDGGIVIDLGRMNGVEVLDPATGRVRLGPGARWGEAAQALAAHGLGMSSGDYGDVGVGGLATAGGIGLMVRRHGLTIDHVVAADVVLADGSIARADAERDPDLLWALRGAGAAFGIVTAVELEAYPVGDVTFATMTFDAADAAGLLGRWDDVMRDAPRELTSFLTLASGYRDGPVAMASSVYAGDDARAAAAALGPLASIGPVLREQAVILPYPAVVAPQGGGHRGGGGQAFRAGLLNAIEPPAAELLAEGLRSGLVGVMQLRSMGGAVGDVDPLATAFAHRHQRHALNAVAGARRADELDALWERLAPHLDGLYLPFEPFRPERLADAFPGETLARLRRLKAIYDPDEVFDQSVRIPPAAPRELAA